MRVQKPTKQSQYSQKKTGTDEDEEEQEQDQEEVVDEEGGEGNLIVVDECNHLQQSCATWSTLIPHTAP